LLFSIVGGEEGRKRRREEEEERLSGGSRASAPSLCDSFLLSLGLGAA
jgi:hypothetical protein